VNKKMESSVTSGFTILAIIAFSFYSIPSIIALIRRKRNTVAIVALNILLGWSIIGWVVSLVWSLTKDQEVQANQIKSQ
jgi:hypothetical protein